MRNPPVRSNCHPVSSTDFSLNEIQLNNEKLRRKPTVDNTIIYSITRNSCSSDQKKLTVPNIATKKRAHEIHIKTVATLCIFTNLGCFSKHRVSINIILLNLFYQYLMTPVKNNNKNVTQAPVSSSCHQLFLNDFSSSAMKTYIMKLTNVKIMRIGMMKMAINSPPGMLRLVIKIHCGTNPIHIKTSAIFFIFSNFIEGLQNYLIFCFCICLANDLGTSENKQITIPNRNTTGPTTSIILLKCENTPSINAKRMTDTPTLRMAFAVAL